MKLDFEKYADGLIPSIVQDAATARVLMLGFMNEAALEMTRSTGLITFHSRSKNRSWTKGETSGNHLELVSITQDCDADTLLIRGRPRGPVCHTGRDTCFGEENLRAPLDFINELEQTISERRTHHDEGSYVASLFEKGLNKIAQKVGEEAVETVIAAKDNDDEAFKNEAADLIFHLLMLLTAKGTSFAEVIDVLRRRRKST